MDGIVDNSCFHAVSNGTDFQYLSYQCFGQFLVREETTAYAYAITSEFKILAFLVNTDIGQKDHFWMDTI